MKKLGTHNKNHISPKWFLHYLAFFSSSTSKRSPYCFAQPGWSELSTRVFYLSCIIFKKKNNFFFTLLIELYKSSSLVRYASYDTTAAFYWQIHPRFGHQTKMQSFTEERSWKGRVANSTISMCLMPFCPPPPIFWFLLPVLGKLLDQISISLHFGWIRQGYKCFMNAHNK